MALIACRECGHEVSTEAVACPHCGASPGATRDAPRVRTSEDSVLTRSRGCGDVLLFLLIVPVIVLLIAVATC